MLAAGWQKGDDKALMEFVFFDLRWSHLWFPRKGGSTFHVHARRLI